MNNKIHKEEVLLIDFFTILKAEVSYESFETKKPIHASRLCLERGDAVAVLLYEVDTDCFLFTKQYRYPSARRNKPIMIELVAGSLDIGEHPESCARREVQEELGYKVEALQLINTYFPSPGGCSEQIHVFYATVHSSEKTTKGGGLATEKESIDLVKIPKAEIASKLKSGFFNNSVSIIGLQWYLLNH
jgi:ADP-ribose pyrophosphatase